MAIRDEINESTLPGEYHPRENNPSNKAEKKVNLNSCTVAAIAVIVLYNGQISKRPLVDLFLHAVAEWELHW